MLASIIIRTYNEQKHLPELLEAIKNQDKSLVDIETVIVDSGSTDQTLKIAEQFNCRITHINKEEFTFGRSLNVGCEFAKGEFLVFISGHCIPVKNDWIQQLVKPMIDNKAVYSYGQQIGRETTKFSEKQVFKKFYPSQSQIPQTGCFCNNANAALLKSAWLEQAFDENLTGLEDMLLAKQLVDKGEKLAYVAEAPVYHIHDETWHQVKVRYEREAIALQYIMPNVHFTLKDFIYCSISSIFFSCLIRLCTCFAFVAL
jgi:glycosyltransferase involved in cell wall biosynthesis